MTRPLLRDQAEAFAIAWEKGYAAGAKHGIKIVAKDRGQMAHAKKRAVQLARWRRYAINRLGLGKQLVAEIDREAK